MQGFNKYYPPDFDPRQTQTLNGYRGVHALGKRAKDGMSNEESVECRCRVARCFQMGFAIAPGDQSDPSPVVCSHSIDKVVNNSPVGREPHGKAL
jgi:hypothetical protein